MKSNMARCQLAKRVGAITLFVLVVLSSSALRADGRTAFLIDRLKSDDFRVRTNAALALGATSDDAAVQPLCGALADSNDVVRQAAAAALKRLGKSAALPCMKARLTVEGSADVKLQITRAVEAIEGGGGGGGTTPVANAKFYVALSVGANNSGHDTARILSAMTGKLDSLGGYQLAPRSETPDAARSVMARRNLKGFYLAVTVELSDTDRGLKALIRVAVFGYPGRDLRGEVAPYAIASGVRRGDANAEESLLKAVAERAVEQFSQNFQ
jgi:hypothetical protein